MSALPEILPIAEAIASLGLGATLTDADEGLLNVLKGMVEDDAREFCRHGITQPSSAYTEYYPQTDRELPSQPGEFANLDVSGNLAHLVRETNQGQYLQLTNIFVQDDASLEFREDYNAVFGQGSGDFGSSTILTQGTEYYLELSESGLSKSGRVVRMNTDWSAKAGTIQATYNAGLSTSDLDDKYRFVKFSILEELVHRFGVFKGRAGNAGAPGPIKAESIAGEWSVTYATELFGRGALLPSVQRRLKPIVNLAGYLGV